MRNLYLLKHALVLVLLLCITGGWAQTTRVTGRVTSGDDGTGLPGVSILEKGTTNGTVTDAEGNYGLSTSQNAVLVFSFVGYTAQEVPVNGRSSIDITLQTDVTALSEVVVVGYGEQEKGDVTGSLTAISTRDFNRGVLTNPQELLVGRVAGVSVISNSGAPGANSTIRIRGGSSYGASNDPLIVIDGFPVDNSNLPGSSNILNSINPNDIESFTVLKDASATAIYGLRASNGVIIITTKKGTQGKPQIQYNGTLSFSTLAKKVDVFSGDEYREYINQKVSEGSVSGLNQAALARLGEENTDWQEEVFQNALSHDHNVNVAGSFKTVPYRLSYGYTDQEGILKNTGFTRNSINVSLTPSLLDDKLKISANLKSAFSKHNFGSEGAVGSAVTFDPTQPVRNGNNIYGGYFTWTERSADVDGVMNPNGPITLIAPSNPVALVEQTDNQSDVTRHIGNLQLDYTLPFLPEMRVNVNAGFDIQGGDGYNNQPSDAAFTFRSGPGSFADYQSENKSQLFDIYVNYLKNLKDHKVDATAGYSFQSFTRDQKSITRIGDGTVIYGDDTDDDGELDGPLADVGRPNDLLSIFGRVNYGFKDKYLLTITVRNDYSSRFNEDNRSGIFPAGSLGWRVSDENFMQEINAVSDLKFRVSYGITGQQDISTNPYPFLPRFQQSTNTAQYQFGDQFYYTYRPAPYDANIKWEETSTLNFGLDFGLFDSKVTGTFDVFNRETTDMIGTVPIAAGSNFSNYLTTNVGDMVIKGYELTLNFNPIRRADFDFNFGVNVTHVNSEVKQLTKTGDSDFFIPTLGIAGGVGNNVGRHAVGQPLNSFYTFQQVYDANGMPIEGLYVDRSGDGGSVISNEENKYYNENPMADYLLGLNSRIRYKSFDFAFSSRISLGNYVYNNVMSSNAVNSQLFNQSGFFSNVPTAIRDTNFNTQQLWSDYYLENGSFFKLDNIGVGYTLDKLANENLRIRLSLTGQNLIVITDYTGIDPEHSNGVDNNIYPRPRTMLFGINITY